MACLRSGLGASKGCTLGLTQAAVGRSVRYVVARSSARVHFPCPGDTPRYGRVTMTTTLLLYWRAQTRVAEQRLRWSRSIKPPSTVRRWTRIARQKFAKSETLNTH